MSIGQLARKFLGPRWFPKLGAVYRSLFVDLAAVAECAAGAIPVNAHVLDIGGGDGEPLNHLLAIRPDISVTMIDLSPQVGTAIREAYRPQVNHFPETSIQQFMTLQLKKPDSILLFDVLHHVPLPLRSEFFKDLHDLVEQARGTNVLIKDIEPGYFRARLSYWADVYISGDKSVRLISKSELIDQVHRLFEDVEVRETDLLKRDSPNYMVNLLLR